MEVCAPSQRNYVGALYMLPWSVGCMLVAGIAYLVRPWRWLQVTYAALCLVSVAFIWSGYNYPQILIVTFDISEWHSSTCVNILVQHASNSP